jgi:hypothetical protein
MGNPFNPFKWWQPQEKKKDEPKPPVPGYQGQGPRPANVPPWQARGQVVQTPAQVVATAERGGNPRMNLPIPSWLGGQRAAVPQTTEQVLSTAGKLGPTVARPSWLYPGRGANVPQLWDKSQHFSPENYAPMTPGAAPATVDTFKQYFGDKPMDYWNKRLADEDAARLQREQEIARFKDMLPPAMDRKFLQESLPIDIGTQTQTADTGGGGYSDGGGYGGGGYGGGGGYNSKLPPWYYGLSTWRI